MPENDRPPDAVSEFKVTRVDAHLEIQTVSRTPHLSVRALLLASERSRRRHEYPTGGPELLALLVAAIEASSSWLLSLLETSAPSGPAAGGGIARWREVIQKRQLGHSHIEALEEAYRLYEDLVAYAPERHTGVSRMPLETAFKDGRPVVNVDAIFRDIEALKEAANPAVSGLFEVGSIRGLVEAFRDLVALTIEDLPGDHPALLEMREIVRRSGTSSLAEENPYVVALPEWEAYKRAPSAPALKHLVDRFRGRSIAPLASTVLALAHATHDWRVLQHMAIVLDLSGQYSYAHVCALEASRMSHGDPRALVLCAHACLRTRRARMLSFYLAVARQRIHKLKDRSIRRHFRSQLIQTWVQAAFYFGHLNSARRWGRALWRDGATLETATQILLGAPRLGEDAAERRAADTLRPAAAKLRADIRKRVEAIVVRDRSSFLRILHAHVQQAHS